MWLFGVYQRKLDSKIVVQSLSVHVTVGVKDSPQGQHVLGLLARCGTVHLD
jgi:hypothetical protein